MSNKPLDVEDIVETVRNPFMRYRRMLENKEYEKLKKEKALIEEALTESDRRTYEIDSELAKQTAYQIHALLSGKWVALQGNGTFCKIRTAIPFKDERFPVDCVIKVINDYQVTYTTEDAYHFEEATYNIIPIIKDRVLYNFRETTPEESAKLQSLIENHPLQCNK